jgi:hypothetical protein
MLPTPKGEINVTDMMSQILKSEKMDDQYDQDENLGDSMIGFGSLSKQKPRLSQMQSSSSHGTLETVKNLASKLNSSDKMKL